MVKAFIFLIFPLFTFAQCQFDELMGRQTSRWRFVSHERDLQELERYRAVYEKRISDLDQQGGEYRIPCDVHLIWLGPKPFPATSVENVRMWVARHPDWRFHFWSDRPRLLPVNDLISHDVADFAFEYLGTQYAQALNWGQKSDLLRYEILNQLGGLYMDHDANCLKSFASLHRAYDFYGCLEMPHTRVDGRTITAGIGVIGAKPHHPLIMGCIEAVLANWDQSLERFPQTSQKSLRDYVMHSTYLALTRSLETYFDLTGNRDIILPASYFYAQKGLAPLYSYHYYGTSWAEIENESELQRTLRLTYTHLIKEQRHLFWALLALLPLTFYSLLRRRIA